MSIGLLFWLIMLLGLLFGFAFRSNSSWAGWYGPYGDWLILFILFGLLGWGVFGPPLHG